MKKYKTSAYSNNIETVECVGETAKMCTIVFDWNGQRHKRKVVKMGDTDQYHDTWDMAYNHLRTRGIAKLDAARSAVNDAHQALLKIEAMTRPKGAKA